MIPSLGSGEAKLQPAISPPPEPIFLTISLKLLLLFRRVQLCEPLDCSTPGFPVLTISPSLLKLMSIESMMPSNHLILCRPLLLLPSIFPSMRVFSNESAIHIRWPKYWSLSFNISPSKEHSGIARQVPLSMGFSRQEYWNGLLCPPPGDFPDPGMKPTSLMSLALAGRFFTTSTT